MITYSVTKTGTGTSNQLIPYGPEIKSDLSPTLQVVTTSACVGSIQLTLDGSAWSDIFSINYTSATSEAKVYDGSFGNFRLNLSSNSGSATLIVGV